MRRVVLLPLGGILVWAGCLGAVSLGQAGRHMMDEMNEGMKRLDSGEYRAAIEPLSRVVDSGGPEKARALVARAYAHLWLKDPYSAVDDLTAAKRLDARAAELLYTELTSRLIHDGLSVKDPAEMETLMENTARLVNEPHAPDGYLARAEEASCTFCQDEDEFERLSALGVCDATMVVADDSEYRMRALEKRMASWNAWGSLMGDKRAYRKMARDVESLISEAGVLPPGGYEGKLAYALIQAEEDDRALRQLNELISDSAVFYTRRSEIFARRSAWKSALADLEEALRIIQASDRRDKDSDLASIYYHRAKIRFVLRDYQAAIDDLAMAVKDARWWERPFACILRARCYQRVGEDEKALAELDAALLPAKSKEWLIDPDRPLPEVYFARALFFADRSNFDRAREEADKGVTSAPWYAEAYFVRAAVYHKMGETAKAAKDRNKAIELDPAMKDRQYPDKFEAWTKGEPQPRN